MTRIKLNSGLASIILLASLFAGWGTLLTVVVLMFLFCDADEKVNGVAIKVITFYAGVSLFTMAWGLIVDGVDLIIASFNSLVGVINGYLESPIDLTKLKLYLLNPISSIVNILDGIVLYLVTFAKFSFIVAVLANKELKENIIVKKINEFVTKVVQYVESLDVSVKTDNVQ